MDSQTVSALIMAAGILIGFGLGLQAGLDSWLTGKIPGIEEPEDTSPHQHLYLQMELFNETVDFSRERYQLQSPKAHFEGGDGEIFHLHEGPVTLEFALESLSFSMNRSCLATGNMTLCSNESHELRVYANGDVVSDPLEFRLAQDDNVMVWYGERDAAPSVDFFDRELPRAYRPQTEGRRI